MKISTKYILFVVIVHLVALVLSFFVFIEEKWIFLVAEAVILVSIYISWQIYQQLIQPLNLLVQGAEAIADRDFNISFLETGSYELDKLIKVYNRMMDELRIERTKQQEQHYFLEKLIHTSPTGIMVLDYDGKIEQVNPMAVNLLDITVEKLLDKQVSATGHPVLLKLNSMQSGGSAMVKMAAATYKVQKSHFMDRGFPRFFVMIEVLTAEILEAEKNAYGKVIRMMAHEVNNTIGPVNSIMDSALKKISSIQGETPLSEALQIAIDRNSNLNIFMRNFADLVRLPSPQKQRVDLMAIVISIARLMETRAGEKKISFRYPANSSTNTGAKTKAGANTNTGTNTNVGANTNIGANANAGANNNANAFFISADQQQIEQVLINIIKNAMESIEEAGEINFKIDPVSRTLVISDTGKGIDDELAQNLFRPFFSTKKDGQGIGLTLIREVLYNHGFNFSLKTVYETPDKRADDAGDEIVDLNFRPKKHTDFTIHF